MGGFELNVARWWPLLLLIPALPFVIQTSRKSIPIQSPARNWMLAGLRAISLLLITILLTGPTLSWRVETRQKPLIAVLLDNSRSLPALGGGLLQEEWLPQLERALGEADLAVYTFGDSLRPVSAEFNPDYNEAISDPAAALNSLANLSAGRELAALLFTGDGVVTRGMPPLEAAVNLACPVIVAASGRKTAPPDLSVVELGANEEVLPGRRQKVRVAHLASGLEGRKLRLRLTIDGSVVDSLDCSALGDGRMQQHELDWLPPSEGDVQLEVEALLLDVQEAETSNNRRRLAVRVLPGKRRVLLLAGRPSGDLAFIRRGLESDPDRLQLDFILSPGRDTPAEKILAAAVRANLIVYIDWPVMASDPMAAELAGLGKAELHVGRVKDDAQDGAVGQIEVLRAHPVLGDESRLDWLRLAWAEMPPLAGSSFKPAAASCLLVDGRGDGLAWISETGSTRRAWLPASGYWRWELAGGIDEELGQRAGHFRDTLIAWLLASPDAQGFQVSPEARTWGQGVPMAFNARAFTEDGRPLSDAELFLNLVHDSGSQLRAAFNSLGDGQYQAVIQGLDAGLWTWSATAQRGDQAMEKVAGSVMIEAWSPEDQARIRNHPLLAELAHATGGQLLDLDLPADREELANARVFQNVVLRPVIGDEIRHRELIDEWVLLILLLGSLGLEWILRRLMGRL